MSNLGDAIAQAWPPFVLVAGLIVIGVVAHADGLFDRAGALVARLPGPPVATLGWCMALVALVTATLNLDTAVVFLTPVLILVARQRAVDERPFLYAALFMANASSLLLPGANLTNLLVLAHDPMSGPAFLRGLLAPAIAAASVTAIGLALLLRVRPAVPASSVGAPSAAPVAIHDPAEPTARPKPPSAPSGSTGAATAPAGQPVGRTGLAGVAVAAVLAVALPHPALPVFAAAMAVAAVSCTRGTTTPRHLIRAVGPAVLLGLFALCVTLGVVARAWHAPAQLLAESGRWSTIAIGALAAIGINNLPAATLLTAHGTTTHARELLIGLNLGPNLAVTGSLASYLWFRAARQVGARPSLLQVSRLGIVLAPAAAIAAGLALSLTP